MKTLPKLLFFILCSLFVHFESYAQKEANNWYFGYGAGINFNYNPPRAVYGGQSSSPFGHASMSDANGNLLFYGAVSGLLGQNHQPIANSNIQIVAGGGTKNVLIVPWPSQPQKYYVFYSISSIWSPYEAYSVVDMAMNNGQGAVTSIKNQYLTYQLWADVIGVKHRNNRDYWVIYQDSVSNKFKSYLIGPAGLDTIPVISTISAIPGVYIVENNLKASPDGKTIAFSDRLSVSNITNSIKLLNFDATSGQLSFKGILPDSTAASMEFSPDGSKLYNMRNGAAVNGKGFPISLVQYDLDLPTTTAIFNSAVVLWQDTVTHPEGYLQVGPDGKIYIIGDGVSHYLHVIHRPNLKGKACRFVPNGLNLNPLNVSGMYNGAKLPTFIQSYFYRPKITMQQTCFGDTAFFALGNPAYVDSVKWNFGDPASGIHNTSTSFNPKHFYATPGPKQVQAIVYFNFTYDTLNQTIYIPVSITKPNLGNDTTLCAGDTLLLNAYQPGATYEWQDSINTDPVFVVTQPGTYWVSVSNGCGTLGDSIVVSPALPLSLTLPADTVLCPGERLALTVNATGGNLLWSDSTTSNTFTVTKPGTYWAQLRNSCGTWTDSITVNYRSLPNADWLNDSMIICKQDKYTINGFHPEAKSYKWQDGSTQSSFTATVSGTYWLEITTTCTTIRDSVNLTLIPSPPLDLGPDQMLCQGEQLTLKVNTRGGAIHWQDNSTDTIFTVTKAGTYWVRISNRCGSWTDSVTITERRCFASAFLPNIVTQNGDNLNDKFEPQGLEIGQWQLEIYNRWGVQIYKRADYTNQWPDKKLSNSTYYYLLRHQQTGKTYKGWVEVSQ